MVGRQPSQQSIRTITYHYVFNEHFRRTEEIFQMNFNGRTAKQQYQHTHDL